MVFLSRPKESFNCFFALLIELFHFSLVTNLLTKFKGIFPGLDSIQAGILLPKLAAFAEYEVADVNRAAAKYTELLKGIVATPVIPEGFLSSWAQYTIRLESKEQRDALQAASKGDRYLQ